MKYQTDAIINTVPAARELRKVSGFNPLKFLQRTTSERTGEKVMKLELPYKQLWFRLACPNGRMVIKPLRITDQIAVFEAMVYASKDDQEPLAQFTSTVSAEEAPNGKFVQTAQDAALNEALENAGFGIQLCDLVETGNHTGFGSEIPVAKIREAQNTAQQQMSHLGTQETVAPPTNRAASVVPSQKIGQAVAPMVKQPNAAAEPPKPVAMQSVPTQGDQVSPAAQQPSAVKPAPEVKQPSEVQQPPVTQSAASQPAHDMNVMNVLFGQPPAPETVNRQVVQADAVASMSAQIVTTEKETAPIEETSATSYTPDMSVEEICQRMTLDEALNFKVQSGVCKGWTLAQVAERRAPSLRFYVYADNGDNVLKAAATLVLNNAGLRKAG